MPVVEDVNRVAAPAVNSQLECPPFVAKEYPSLPLFSIQLRDLMVRLPFSSESLDALSFSLNAIEASNHAPDMLPSDGKSTEAVYVSRLLQAALFPGLESLASAGVASLTPASQTVSLAKRRFSQLLKRPSVASVRPVQTGAAAAPASSDLSSSSSAADAHVGLMARGPSESDHQNTQSDDELFLDCSLSVAASEAEDVAAPSRHDASAQGSDEGEDSEFFDATAAAGEDEVSPETLQKLLADVERSKAALDRGSRSTITGLPQASRRHAAEGRTAREVQERVRVGSTGNEEEPAPLFSLLRETEYFTRCVVP